MTEPPIARQRTPALLRSSWRGPWLEGLVAAWLPAIVLLIELL